LIDVTFDKTPEQRPLHMGDEISGALCLKKMENMSEEAAESYLQGILDMGYTINVSDIPKDFGSDETAVRLRLEQKLVKSGRLIEGLEEKDPLRLYLEEVAAIPAVGDVTLLAEQSAAGDASAQAKLVNLFLSQVVESAYEMTGRGVMLLDLIQEGSIGLWNGVLQYTKGDFAEHALLWIQRYLTKAVLLQAHCAGIVQKMRRGMEDYRDMDQRLLAELGRTPTVEEIAEAIHVTVEEASTYAAMLAQVRFHQQVHKTAQPEQEDQEENQAVEDTAYFQARQRILELLSTLTDREAKLLTLRFGLENNIPKNHQETGEIMGLTPDEVVELETAALLKLRQQAQ